MESELERRTIRLVAARKALTELPGRSWTPGPLAEIDQAHAQVEAAERRLASAWLPWLARRSRRRLVAARASEQAVLAAHGHASWLGLQLAQVDALLEPPTPEAVAAAELEYHLAVASWEEMADDGEPAAGDGTRTGRESLPQPLRQDGPRPAVA